VFRNEPGSTALKWVQGNARSNFDADRGFETLEFAGESALRYTWTGLYEGESIAVQKGEYIYLLSFTYGQDDQPIRGDFEEFMGTFEFLKDQK
jgi:hypothetical protein